MARRAPRQSELAGQGTAGSREDIVGGGNFTKGVERLEYICGQRNQTLKSLVVYTDPIKF